MQIAALLVVLSTSIGFAYMSQSGTDWRSLGRGPLWLTTIVSYAWVRLLVKSSPLTFLLYWKASAPDISRAATICLVFFWVPFFQLLLFHPTLVSNLSTGMSQAAADAAGFPASYRLASDLFILGMFMSFAWQILGTFLFQSFSKWYFRLFTTVFFFLPTFVILAGASLATALIGSLTEVPGA